MAQREVEAAQQWVCVDLPILPPIRTLGSQEAKLSVLSLPLPCSFQTPFCQFHLLTTHASGGAFNYFLPATRHTPRLAKQREVKQFLQHGCQGTVPPWTHYDEVPQELKQCGDRERPDFLWNDDGKRGWCVILEVDEHQHQERPEFCECARMLNVSRWTRRRSARTLPPQCRAGLCHL